MEPFLMPRVSLSDDEEMVVSRWLVAPGTEVREGQPILEVETAKANMEVEAPRGGVLGPITLSDGAPVSPGDTLAVILDPGEIWEPTDSGAPPAAAGAGHHASAPATATLQGGRSLDGGRVTRSIGVPDFDHPGDLYGLPAAATSQPSRSPLPIPPAMPDASQNGALPPRSVPEGGTSVPLTRHRLAVGRIMTESWSIPQFTVRRDLQMDEALRTVERLRDAGLAATLTDVLVRSVARTLVAHPESNRLFVGSSLYQLPSPVVSLAVDSPAGVVAPVIARAHDCGWDVLVRERRRIVQGARDGRLLPKDLNGGTFSISNVGPLGADAVIPLITPPQVAILGLGAVRTRDGGSYATAQFVGDHRALDGADAARFLTTLQELLSTPADLAPHEATR